MLTDPREIEIIQGARQKNVRDPSRSRQHFEDIFEDFLAAVHWPETRVLDLGPGQFDFGVLAEQRGAIPWGIDNDAAVLELGRYKGQNVVEGNLKKFRAAQLPLRFGGIFCKFSINAFWFHDRKDQLRTHTREIAGALEESGWSWIAPWNGVPKKAELSPDQIEEVLNWQREAFAEHGFLHRQLSVEESKRYGVHGATADHAVFTRNLQIAETF